MWKRAVFGGSIGGFFGGAAFDGQHIFSATAVGDPPGFFRCSSDTRDLPSQEPSMHALNLYPLNAAGYPLGTLVQSKFWGDLAE